MTPRTVLHFSIGPAGLAVLGLLTVPLLAWVLSVEQLGQYAMLQLVISFSVLFFSLGLDQSFVREFHESENKPNLFALALWPGLLLFLPVIVFTIFKAEFISQWLYAQSDISLAIYTVLAVFTAFLSKFWSLTLRMDEKGLLYSCGQLAPKVVFLMLLVGLWSGEVALNFPILVAIQVTSLCCGTLLFILFRPDYLKALLVVRWQAKIFKRLISFALPLMVGGLVYWGLVAADRVMLRQMTDFSELGIYSVAFTFVSAAMVLQSIFSTLWAPTVYKAAVHNPERVAFMVNQAAGYIAVAVFSLFSLGGFFCWIFWLILPPQYNELPYIFIGCLAFPLFYMLSEVTVVGVALARKSLYLLLASLVAFICNLLGNFWLIPLFGATGAAAATAIAFWLFFILRTEFSVMSGLKIKRIKLYIVALVYLAGCLLATLKGPVLGCWAFLLWVIPSILAITLYWEIYGQVMFWLRQKTDSYFAQGQK